MSDIKYNVKFSSILILVLTVTSFAFSQSTEDPKPIFVAENMPEYSGGNENLTKIIASKIKLPPITTATKEGNTVYLNFVVDTVGAITEIKVLRGINPKYNEEAVRVLQSLVGWEPGTLNGKPVNVHMAIPISFGKDNLNPSSPLKTKKGDKNR